jgi:hypothetical protein
LADLGGDPSQLAGLGLDQYVGAHPYYAAALFGAGFTR